VLQHDFLSQVANFPKGPFVLSTVLAKPVLMLNCLNQNGRYHIYFDQLWSGGHVPKRERDQFIESLAAAYVKKLQYYVVKAPYQWFNFFNFWHQASERK
jgi:predicted LPLAT superfamily acyltransferase